MMAVPRVAPPAKVLIVDDRPVDREYYRTVLDYGGYEVIEATNGTEALESIRQHHPDLVVTDVMMPTMDGYALVRTIRGDPAIAATRVIFCSAIYHEKAAEQLATALGAELFLVKPVEPQALLAAVKEVLCNGPRPASEMTPTEVESAHLRLLNDKLMARTAELEAEIAARQQVELDLRNHRDRLELLVAERTAGLEAANRELQSFAYAASHDLRAPVERITRFCTMLAQNLGDRLDGDGIALLAFIRQNAERMAALIDDLLQHAQVEQQALDLHPVALRAIVQGLLQEMSEDIRRGGTEVRLELPDIVLQANANALKQVLRNLLENALKYSARAEHPVVAIGAQTAERRCRLWVRDNGIGFDMVYHDRIFELFRRLHTYSEYPGSGVGLALVRKALDRMGGRVWAESTLGDGATFFVELPALAPEIGTSTP